MLTEIIIIFLGSAIVCYVLFGGVGLGAGVLEMISGIRDRESISNVVGLVWGIHHAWLILILGILYIGFPAIYSNLSLYLHIPLLIVLGGIIFHGISFAFMHIDAITGRNNRIYRWVFRVSSIVTPIFLGVIIGAVVLGRVNMNPETFQEGFIDPWFNLFSITVGLFTLILFTFLASVYMIGEISDDRQINSFITISKTLNAGAVALGILVFSLSEINGLGLIWMFVDSTFAIIMVVGATLSLPLLWWALQNEKKIVSRIIAAAQVASILFAWFWVQMPVVIRLTTASDHLTFYNSVAPQEILWQLAVAIIVAISVILLAHFYMTRVNKKGQLTAE